MRLGSHQHASGASVAQRFEDDFSGQRGLARSGSADEGGQRTGPGSQLNILEQLLAIYAELNLTHLEPAGAGRGFSAADQDPIGENQVDVADRDHVAVLQRIDLLFHVWPDAVGSSTVAARMFA